MTSSLDPRITTLIAQYREQAGALLPLLHAIQEVIGYVPAVAVAPIAKALNLSRAEVHGVLTYYHFFRTEPAPTRVVQICRAEACQACGSEALWAVAQAYGQAGVVGIESVYCLGLCAAAPAMQVDEVLYGRASSEGLHAALAVPAPHKQNGGAA